MTRFYSPQTPEEAVRLLREGDGAGRYVAGGTDLLCERAQPDFYVNVERLSVGVRRDGDEVVVGAGTTVAEIEASEELGRIADGLLPACARAFAGPQIRHMATLGGNLVSAVPSADFAPPLLALEADCVLLGADGIRRVPLAHFFTGPHACAAGDDLLLEVRFPVPASGTRAAFEKLGRNPGDIAIVNAAAVAELDGGRFARVRLALGAVHPTPMRATEAEAYLAGKPATAEHVARAAALAQAAVQTIGDQRAGAAYRRHLSAVLARRALERCLREAA